MISARTALRLLLAVSLASPLALLAQSGNVTVTCAVCEAQTSVTPPFVVIATNFSAGPLRYTVQVASDPQFRTGVELDTTITTTNTVLSVAPSRALSGGVRFFYRATVADAAGGTTTSSTVGPFIVPQWVQLVTPPTVIGQPERTLQPTFRWRSPLVNEPPGPWQYTITITNRNGISKSTDVGARTTYQPGPTDLEANSAYTWSITARLPNARPPQSTTVGPSETFTTEDTTLAVTSTQFLLPFPNPFPYVIAGEEQNNGATCLWFDLRAPSTVTLDVYTYRGAHVRRLLPNSSLGGQLPAGRYGRGRGGTSESCDPTTRWDGRDDRGRDVPEGVYLIRFRGDGVEKTRKVTFRGR